ncbi:MAG: hypothetical protein EA379_00095 [Phycisphaerales bacterium]|nr:MAG: hypothetical protein EA379_00095 [Phycisphaerales bacterium]
MHFEDAIDKLPTDMFLLEQLVHFMFELMILAALRQRFSAGLDKVVKLMPLRIADEILSLIHDIGMLRPVS